MNRCILKHVFTIILKIFLIIAFCLICVFHTTSYAETDTKSSDFNSTAAIEALQVIGSDLCDSSGDKFQLRGISTHGLQWYPQYINYGCFKYFRDNWGCNLIRLAMYTEDGGYTTSSQKALELNNLVIKGADLCTDLGMYCIIDWHILNDGNPLKHLEESKYFFDSVSYRYRNNKNIIYEICNEPNGGTSWEDIKNYARQIIPVIRANAPDAIILVGTPFWSQNVDMAAADPLSSEYNHNVMYTMHFYAATHKEDLQTRLISAKNSGLPIFISEFSSCDASGNGNIDYASASKWFTLIKENNLSYAGWNLSNKNESSAILRPETSNVNGDFHEGDFSESGRLLKALMSQ